jgi:hypothetical protein
MADKILKAADDIANVFGETTEWLDPKRAAVVKILKELVEKHCTSANEGLCDTCRHRYKCIGIGNGRVISECHDYTYSDTM